MKQVFKFLTVFLLITSCNNANNNTPPVNFKAEENLADRHIMIEELKRIQKILASNDRDNIASLFKFPLSHSSYSIYIDDTTYYSQLQSNGDKITEAMFFQYFDQVSGSILISELNDLFNKIDVDSLLHRDSLGVEAYIETKPCYYSYHIEVGPSSVMLRMHMNLNDSYISKNLLENGIPDDPMCEHSMWWVFRLDGNQLNLTGISGAG